MYADQAVTQLRLETQQQMSTERKAMKAEESVTSIALMNHVLHMSKTALDNSMAMGRAAQSPSGASSSSLLLPNNNSTPDLIPNPGLPALLGPSAPALLGPQPVDGGGGKGKGKGSGSGKGQGRPVERRLAPDGNAYTMSEFQEFFGGLDEWQAANPVWH